MRNVALSALLLAGAVLTAAPTAPLAAKTAATPPAVDSAKLFDALTACRAITDSAARLGCFDKAAAALDSAKANKDIVVLDREMVNKTKRGLFGLSLPTLGLFGASDSGGKAAEVEQLKQIDGVIAKAHEIGNGKWQVTLEDGANWQTTEVVSGRDPRIGQKLRIERGAMGGYIMSLEGGRSFRVARVN